MNMGPEFVLDLNQLHQQILDRLGAQFPLLTVEDYRDDFAAGRSDLVLPALIVELEDLEAAPEEDPGTQQLAMVARFSATLVMGFRTVSVKREIRKLAGAVAVFVHKQRWGMPVGPAQVLAAVPDASDPALDNVEVWRVEWQQILALGESVWANDGQVPLQVLYSIVPEIGIPFEGEYDPVDLTSPVGPELG